MRSRSLALLMFVPTLIVPGSTAWAQDNGVHVDPNSPSGTEYQIPFASARDESGGKGAGQAQQTDSSGQPSVSGQPAGEGVTQPGAQTAPATTPKKQSKSGDTSTTGAGAVDQQQLPTLAGRRVAADDGSGGFSPALAAGLIVLVVLLLGGLASRFMRSRRPDGTDLMGERG